jgi:uncharacterized membrane protein
MGRGADFGQVYVDVPPMPQVVFPATSFPIVLPANVRGAAMGVMDMQGMLSLTHNATNGTPPSFSFFAWSDQAGWWMLYSAIVCAQYGIITWKAYPNTPFYIFASAALTGGASAKVVIGGITIEGTVPFPAAGV